MKTPEDHTTNQTAQSADSEHKLAEARRYADFQGLGELEQQVQNLAESEDDTDRESRQQEFDSLVSQIDGGLDALRKSQEAQRKYGLVEKFLWDDSGNPVEAAFKSGARAMEVNIRLNADNQFIIQHHPTVQPNAALEKSAKGKLVHEMTTEELADKTKILPLDEALKTLAEYKDNDHKLILQLKTLGSGYPTETLENLATFQQKLDEYDVANNVVVSSLSPTILAAVHEAMPDMPLIMNTAVTPVISYPKEASFGAAIGKALSLGKGWAKLGTKRWHVLLATAEGAMKAPEKIGGDGQGKNNQYLMTAIPQEVIEAVAGQRAQTEEFGGAMSVAAVSILASALEALGAKNKAADMRQKAIEKIHSMNLSVQTTTWGGLKNKNGPLKALNPLHQIEQAQQAGFDAEKFNDTFYVKKAAELGLKLAGVEPPE
jgi:hypothetical protein